MNQTSRTALVSAFARAHHTAHNYVKIFEDSVAKRLLTDEESGNPPATPSPHLSMQTIA